MFISFHLVATERCWGLVYKLYCV